MRDLGRMEDAIKAYEEALRVTAGSSYPQGNLAALLLHRASHLENPEFREEIEEDALDAFQLTEQFAYAELAQRPSDFFLLMDIAMAATILSCRDAKYKFTARQFFERAMNKRASEELLNVNMRGWQFLLANCPKGSRWGEVRGELQASINDLNHALAQLKAE